MMWLASEDLAAFKSKRAAARAACAAAAKEREANRIRSVRQRADEDAAVEAFAGRPLHRLVPREAWTGGMPARGVPSVFHLGASLS